MSDVFANQSEAHDGAANMDPIYKIVITIPSIVTNYIYWLRAHLIHAIKKYDSELFPLFVLGVVAILLLY